MTDEATVEVQARARLIIDLSDKYADRVPAGTIEAAVHAAWEEVSAQARIDTYIPVLAGRRANHVLAGQVPPAT
jgi:hypothetical protein